MLPYHVALVSDESSIKLDELTSVAAALQKQVLRDFGPIWGIQADVSAFAALENVPLDYWPVIIKDDIGDPSAAGYHQDQHGQPYSLIQYADDWTLTASHEVLEMLGDPFGRRMIAGESPIAGQGRVQFLVEVCDPCEASQYAYSVNGIVVSDFYTPHFFDPATSNGAQYDFGGAIQKPRDVLQGGYLSWYVPATQQWWQRTWFGDGPSDNQLQNLKIQNGNPRNAIDRVTARDRAKAMRLKKAEHARRAHDATRESFTQRAKALRMCVSEVTGA